MTMFAKARSMRLLILGSMLAGVSALPGRSAAQSGPSGPSGLSPVQAWAYGVRGKVATSAYRERRPCRKRCAKGRVVIAFVVARDGQVSDLRVSKSSGSPALDARGIRAVQGAAPLPRMPPEITEATKTVTVPLSFN